jgi:DNA polymerase-3 subunit beta
VKFRVERDVLAEAVTWTARSLSPRPPVPVLSGLLLKAESGTVSLSSFDYETSARLEIPADIRDEGTILVSGRLLADICRSLPSAPVDIETDGNKVTLTCRRSSFHLATMPEAEYPPLPALPTITGTVAGDAFAQAVSQVIIAASKDDTLPKTPVKAAGPWKRRLPMRFRLRPLPPRCLLASPPARTIRRP